MIVLLIGKYISYMQWNMLFMRENDNWKKQINSIKCLIWGKVSFKYKSQVNLRILCDYINCDELKQDFSSNYMHMHGLHWINAFISFNFSHILKIFYYIYKSKLRNLMLLKWSTYNYLLFYVECII